MTDINEILKSTPDIVEFEKFLKTVQMTQTWYGGRRVTSIDPRIKGSFKFKELTHFAFMTNYTSATIATRLKELNDAGNLLYKSNCLLLILRALGRFLARIFSGDCCIGIDHNKDIAKIAKGGNKAYAQWDINSLPVDLRPENHAAIRTKLAELPKAGGVCGHLTLLHGPKDKTLTLTFNDLAPNHTADQWLIYGYAFISGYIPVSQPWELGFRCFETANHPMSEKIFGSYTSDRYCPRSDKPEEIALLNNCKSARNALPAEGLKALWQACGLNRLFKYVIEMQSRTHASHTRINELRCAIHNLIAACFIYDSDGHVSCDPYVRDTLIKLLNDVERDNTTPSYLLTLLFHFIAAKFSRTKEKRGKVPGELSDEVVGYLLKSLGASITDAPDVRHAKIEQRLSALNAEGDQDLREFGQSIDLLIAHYKVKNNNDEIVKLASILFNGTGESYEKIHALHILESHLPASQFNTFVLNERKRFPYSSESITNPLLVVALVARFELRKDVKDLEDAETILKKITKRVPIGPWKSVDHAAEAIAEMIKNAKEGAAALLIAPLPTKNILGHAW